VHHFLSSICAEFKETFEVPAAASTKDGTVISRILQQQSGMAPYTEGSWAWEDLTHKVLGHLLGLFSMPGKACWWELYQNAVRPTLIANSAFYKSLISGWLPLEGLIKALPYRWGPLRCGILHVRCHPLRTLPLFCHKTVPSSITSMEFKQVITRIIYWVKLCGLGLYFV
jgi:hypothetical protein